MLVITNKFYKVYNTKIYILFKMHKFKRKKMVKIFL